MYRRIGQIQPLGNFSERWMRALVIVAALIVVLFAPIAGDAQSTTGSISGTVTDSSGAIVVGASITVVNTATGVTYHTTSDSLGSYRVTQLPPGSYTMEVTSSGFETQNLQAFKLYVDQKLQQNLTLAVGKATQSVSVSA